MKHSGMSRSLIVTMLVFGAGAGAGGCGKKGGGEGDSAKGAPSCADAAANYVTLELANKLPSELIKLKPTAAQQQALAALIAAQCETGAYKELTNKPWTPATRLCVANAKPSDVVGKHPSSDCFNKMGRGASLPAAQIVHDFVEAEKAKVAAAAAPPIDSTGTPIAPGTGTGTGTGTDSGSGTGSGSAAGTGSGSTTM